MFDEADDRYAVARAELRALVVDDEWAAAQRTTLNAHYTDPAVVTAMWDGLTQMGFTSGRVLEPGCGSGNFIGFAEGRGAEMIGVERDPTSARIAQALYPDADIHNVKLNRDLRTRFEVVIVGDRGGLGVYDGVFATVIPDNLEAIVGDSALRRQPTCAGSAVVLARRPVTVLRTKGAWP